MSIARKEEEKKKEVLRCALKKVSNFYSKEIMKYSLFNYVIIYDNFII